MECPDATGPTLGFDDPVSRRLLESRTVIHNGTLTPTVGGQLTEQLTVLDTESSDPIQIVLTSVPGGSFEAGLSLYDLIRSLTAPVTMLGSGQIAGAGVVMFVGVAADRRFALPHARFRLEELGGDRTADRTTDLQQRAERVSDRRDRLCALLAEATGRGEEQIRTDLTEQKRLDADAAVDYGLVRRVVESREEVS